MRCVGAPRPAALLPYTKKPTWKGCGFLGFGSGSWRGGCTTTAYGLLWPCGLAACSRSWQKAPMVAFCRTVLALLVQPPCYQIQKTRLGKGVGFWDLVVGAGEADAPQQPMGCCGPAGSRLLAARGKKLLWSLFVEPRWRFSSSRLATRYGKPGSVRAWVFWDLVVGAGEADAPKQPMGCCGPAGSRLLAARGKKLLWSLFVEPRWCSSSGRLATAF